MTEQAAGAPLTTVRMYPGKWRLVCVESGRVLRAMPDWAEVQEDGSVLYRYWCDRHRGYHHVIGTVLGLVVVGQAASTTVDGPEVSLRCRKAMDWEAKGLTIVAGQEHMECPGAYQVAQTGSQDYCGCPCHLEHAREKAAEAAAREHD